MFQINPLKSHLVLAIACLSFLQIHAQEQIGVASAVNKNTTDLTLEQERKLIDAGYEIIQNHTIETDEIGRAQMMLLDGTAFSVGPNSSVVLDKFIYNPETAEGSLEVTARGLLRIVGGKVTKKQPALIRTNSATVGIRGGIGIIQTVGSQTNATFLYGQEMTVTPNCVDLDTFADQCSPDFETTVTEPGFSVSVEDESSEPSEPVEVTEESLDELQGGLEAPEESSEESSSEESSEESEGESSDENSSEESEESEESSEESEGESSEESSSEESEESSEESEGESTEESSSEESEGSSEETQEETSDTSSDESEGSSETESSADSSSDASDQETQEGNNEGSDADASAGPDTEESSSGASETSDVDQSSQTPDSQETDMSNSDAGTSAEDSSDIEVDESMLDSSGVSDVSSDAAPEDLGTADAYEAQVEVETVEADDANEDTTEDVTETATDSTQEATTEVAPLFQVDALNPADSINENTVDHTLAPINIVNPGNLNFTVTISGDDAELVTFDQETSSIVLIAAVDHEVKSDLSFNVSIESENGDVFELAFSINVNDINEPLDFTSNATADAFAENIEVGSIIAETSAVDPEGETVTYSLSGEGSENFEVDSNGNVVLKNALDFETVNSFTLTLSASDGTNTSSEEIIFTVQNIDEAPVLSSTLEATSFSEDLSIGSSIASISGLDPESSPLTYSLSGEGSELFTVDSQGNITLASALDFETTSSFELTLTVSDGVHSVSESLTFSITDINEVPDTSISLAASAFEENVSLGTSIATVNVIDPESSELTYTLSGEGSDKFTVDENGNITLKSAFDFETTSSYSLTLTVSDGVHSVTENFTFSILDVTELSIQLASNDVTINENVNSGTAITSTTTTIDGNSTVSYSLSGTGSDKFSVDSNGNITTNGTLDYETTTSYSITLTATDGINTVSETLTVSVANTDLSIELASSTISLNESVSSGTAVTSTTATNPEGTVSYSLSGTGSDKFSVDSNGNITTNGTLDYETTTSYSITLTATDGTTTTTQSFTVNVADEILNGLATTLANSGAPLSESSSSGTSVASSSVNNPDSDSVSYALSGTGSSNFTLDSNGNVTTNATLDFETAKSYSLTLTASGGGNTTTDNFTVNVGNVEELESAVLRYSADYNSASRSGFSATATRGPSGSSLAAYTLEQVGTTNSTAITSVDDTTNNFVPVEINSGTALNWRYYFPIDTSGNGQFAFAPNSSALDGKYYSPLGTAVTTTIANADFLTAGRLEGAEYWFMTTDKAGSNISYQSSAGQRTYGVIVGDTSTQYGGGYTGVGSHWQNSITGAGYTFQNCVAVNVETCLNNAGINLDDVGIIVNNSPGTVTFGYTYSELADWIDGGGNYAAAMWEHSGWSTRGQNGDQHEDLFAGLGWSGFSGNTVSGYVSSNSTITQSTVNNITNAGGTLNYSALVGNNHIYHANGLMNIPSVCDSLVNGIIGGATGSATFICDPGRTGSSGAVLGIADYNAYAFNNSNSFIMNWFAGLGNGSATTSTYNLYEDQVTLAGEVYKDANFVSFTNGNKRVIAMAVIPIENFAASGTSNDYFIPNFIPKTLWSYGDVGHDYCLGVGNNASACNTYDNYYDFSSIALDSSDMVDTSRFNGSTNELPEGQSMWWQVLNPSGIGVGLWAQISLKDSYDGASGSTTRDDQQSLLNVVISNVDYRKNDTTRYSAGDTGLGMDGYHYWSYQGATNADNDGLGINYGTSPIECATSNDSGCFWGDSSNQPGGAMITSSDPYKSGDMTLGVNYNSNNDTFSTGSFNVSAVVQDVKPSSSSYADYASLSDFRSSDFYSSSATGYSGFFSGILEFDVSGTGNTQLSSIRSSSTLATFTFDTTNDDVQVVAPMTISAAPSNNYTSNWSTVDTGSMTLKFGDDTNDEAKSAYISSEVFAAEIQDDGAQIDGTSGGSNNLAGVMVSYNTLDKEDSDLFHTNGNDSMPDTAYSTWGFWAMSAVDVSSNSGTQNASVHLGTWVGGEVVDQSEIPTSGSASMSGAAVMNVAYRYDQTGTNYDVHKYTTTADVSATFNWGSSGYSGTLAFTNFDDKNPIVSNAGFTSFSVAIAGTSNTYTGNSTDSLDNLWLGGASVTGALYGGSSPDESGGNINVNLYKSGDTNTAGANDFYMAEGIYLVD